MPALSQSALVAGGSAEKAGAVKAIASPSATIIETTLFMGFLHYTLRFADIGKCKVIGEVDESVTCLVRLSRPMRPFLGFAHPDHSTELGDVPVEPHFAKGREATPTWRDTPESPHMEMPMRSGTATFLPRGRIWRHPIKRGWVSGND